MSPGFRIVEPASLRQRNTFGVEARATRLVEVSDSGALPVVFGEGHADAASLVLGGGSNLLFAGDPEAPVVALTARGHALVGGHDDVVIVRADAGAPWHPFVLWTLQQGLSGLQNLALIPGTVGAAPIQNIGAYGVEVGDCIHAVEVFDREAGGFQRLGRSDCAFAYRDSVFKREPGRHIVTGVEFLLSRTPRVHTGYAGLGEELAAMGIDAPTPRQVADAVIRIRTRKLPDPAVIGNAGSFFKNPIVPAMVADTLAARHPALPAFCGDSDHTRKLSAAWLIDQCGWKGHRDGDAGVSDRHALVLVNHGTATGAQLLALARRIAASVRERFGIAIEPEPRIVGAAW
jgi:UDP-N-acetylmuramate dehydrogenase